MAYWPIGDRIILVFLLAALRCLLSIRSSQTLGGGNQGAITVSAYLATRSLSEVTAPFCTQLKATIWSDGKKGAGVSIYTLTGFRSTWTMHDSNSF